MNAIAESYHAAMPSEKVARLGIRRESGQLYFLRGDELWKAPMVAPDWQEPRRYPERVAVGGFECEEGWGYFFDSDGDISRFQRQISAASRTDRDRASALTYAAGVIRQRATEQSWCAEAVQQLQPSLRLHLMPRLPNDVVGKSRFGGLPDLPAGTEWPKWDGAIRPDFVMATGQRVPKSIPPTTLSFIAQLNLADLPTDDLVPLPRRGVLSFFYDAEHQPWGFDPTDRGSTRVLYFDEPSHLARAQKPDDLPEFYSYRGRAVGATWEATLRDKMPGQSPPRDPAVVVYRELVDELVRPGNQHRMLGHAQPVQLDSMQLECQLVTNGIDCGDLSGKDPQIAAHRAAAAEWMLLLQIDSDDALGWSWGDAGRLYFWIRKRDLAARQFDNVWTILQCH